MLHTGCQEKQKALFLSGRQRIRACWKATRCNYLFSLEDCSYHWLTDCLTDWLSTVLLADWLSYWLTDWPSYRLTDCLTDNLTDCLTDWLARCLTDWLSTVSLADWLSYRQTDWLTNWLTILLTDWLTVCLTDWLTDWFTGWLAGWLSEALWTPETCSASQFHLAGLAPPPRARGCLAAGQCAECKRALKAAVWKNVTDAPSGFQGHGGKFFFFFFIFFFLLFQFSLCGVECLGQSEAVEELRSHKLLHVWALRAIVQASLLLSGFSENCHEPHNLSLTSVIYSMLSYNIYIKSCTLASVLAWFITLVL